MKCVLPTCQNVEGESPVQFFAVPPSSSKCYPRWKEYMYLSGLRTERICKEHFTSSDFITYNRKALKPKAVPVFRLPQTKPKVDRVGVCCIKGCTIKKPKNLYKFPTEPRKLQTWKKILCITDSTKLRICDRHFALKDFSSEVSFYLKTSAVPSKKVKKLVKFPKRFQRMKTPPSHLWDHAYCKWYSSRPKSHKICYVQGCGARATKGTSLHKFPAESEKRFMLWINTLKCKLMPTKNSKVCSKHFSKEDYVVGQSRLKETAVPSRRIPGEEPFSSSSSTESSPNSAHAAKRFKDDRLAEESTSTDDDDYSYDSPDEDTDRLGAVTSPYASDHGLMDVPRGYHGDTEESSSTRDTTRGHQTNPEESCSTWDTTRGHQTNPEESGSTWDTTPYAPHHGLISTSRGYQADPEESCSSREISKRSIEITKSTIRKLQQEKKQILSDLLITDKEVSIWTGISTLEQLQEICIAARNLEDCLFARGFKMDITDRVILTMAKLKQNVSFEALGILFRISGATVSAYFSHTIQILARVLKRFVYWPDKEELKKNIPLCFREHFPKVTVILDATEIPVCTLQCLNCRIACYSNYKSRRTIKFLVGVSPAGLITFISNAYSGKASDKMIFNEEKLIDRMIPHVDEIMVDKGVSIETECTLKCIKLHMPPFMRGDRLSPVEASHNEAIARARIHVERVIQRIKIFAILNTTISIAILPHIDSIMQVICGIVNLSPPILNDDKF